MTTNRGGPITSFATGFYNANIFWKFVNKNGLKLNFFGGMGRKQNFWAILKKLWAIFKSF